MSPLDVETLCARIRVANKKDNTEDLAEFLLALLCGTAENIAEINQSLKKTLEYLEKNV